jgi:two-component system nitrate/nitrite response regulator NarL
MDITSVRILLIEDFAPFLKLTRSILADKPGLQIIAEALDGRDGVQKATELKPDLILLDIGLPKMNGIEAARQIRKLVPDSKILFVSQESSPDIIQEALSLGASGYVVKTKVGRDLLPAVDAVLQGRTFVSGQD